MSEHEIPFETRQAMFMQEAAEIESKYGREGLESYFQNLSLSLYDEYRHPELLDHTPEQVGQSEQMLEYNSEFRKQQTYRDFYEHLDSAAKKLEIYDDLKSWMLKMEESLRNLGSPNSAGFLERREALKQLKLQALPNLKKLYAALRAEGYNMYDITGHTPEQFLEEQNSNGRTTQRN